jgi:hypothetical protein
MRYVVAKGSPCNNPKQKFIVCGRATVRREPAIGAMMVSLEQMEAFPCQRIAWIGFVQRKIFLRISALR